MRAARWTTMGTISKREVSTGESVLEIFVEPSTGLHVDIARLSTTDVRQVYYNRNLDWVEIGQLQLPRALRAGWREDVGGPGTWSEGGEGELKSHVGDTRWESKGSTTQE